MFEQGYFTKSPMRNRIGKYPSYAPEIQLFLLKYEKTKIYTIMEFFTLCFFRHIYKNKSTRLKARKKR